MSIASAFVARAFGGGIVSVVLLTAAYQIGKTVQADEDNVAGYKVQIATLQQDLAINKKAAETASLQQHAMADADKANQEKIDALKHDLEAARNVEPQVVTKVLPGRPVPPARCSYRLGDTARRLRELR